MHIALIHDKTSLEKEISEKSLVLFEDSLKELDYSYEIITRPKDRDIFLQKYKNFDLAIPVIHGWFGEWGQMSALFELLDIPYLFSDHNAHSLCFNKYNTNLVIQDLWYSIPKSIQIIKNSDFKISFPWPYFIKPNTSWSSLDCGIFDTLDQANDLIQNILWYDTVLVQEVIKGREFTVSITGDYDKNPKVLWIMEILTEKEFFDYDAKYKREKTKEIFPDLSDALKKEIESISINIYKKLQLRDIARVDFLYKDEKLYFLEVNTIPGMTPMSFFPQCVKNYWYNSFSSFLKELIKNKLN